MSSCLQRLVITHTLILTFCLVIFSTTHSYAAKKAAHSTLEQGVLAGSAGDWWSANDYFLEINAENAQHLPALFNLGLSNAKLGRELVSLAWFIAYMYSDPETIHKKELLSAIDELFLDSQQHIRDILTLAENSADKLDDDSARTQAYAALAKTYASMGWFDEAESFWRRYHRYVPQGDVDDHDSMLRDYAENLILAGSYQMSYARISEISNRAIKQKLKGMLAEHYQPSPFAWIEHLFNVKTNSSTIRSEDLVKQAQTDMGNAYIANTPAVLEALKILPPKEIPTKLTDIAQAHILAITYWQQAYRQLSFE